MTENNEYYFSTIVESICASFVISFTIGVIIGLSRELRFYFRGAVPFIIYTPTHASAMIESINFLASPTISSFHLLPVREQSARARVNTRNSVFPCVFLKSLRPETERKSMAETNPYSIFEMVAAHRSLVSHATRSCTRARLSVLQRVVVNDYGRRASGAI